MDVFRSIRWADGVYCPHCKSFNISKKGYTYKYYSKDSYIKIRRYRCKDCHKTFNDFANTLFSNIQVPITVFALIMFTMGEFNIKDIAEVTGYDRKTVYLLIKKIQYGLSNYHENLILDSDKYIPSYESVKSE